MWYWNGLWPSVNDVAKVELELELELVWHRRFIALLISGEIRWEWLPSKTCGEVCFNGFRHIRHIGPDGCPTDILGPWMQGTV